MKNSTSVRARERSAEACAEILARMAGGNLDERNELLRSGAAYSAVDSLYPLPYEDFLQQVWVQFSQGGAKHLSKRLISNTEWQALIELSDRLCSSFGPNSGPFEMEWDRHDGPNGTWYALSEVVFAQLDDQRSAELANEYTYYFGRSLLASHWLLRYPNLAAASGEDANEQYRWVVNRLLPPQSAD